MPADAPYKNAHSPPIPRTSALQGPACQTAGSYLALDIHARSTNSGTPLASALHLSTQSHHADHSSPWAFLTCSSRWHTSFAGDG
ncbi:hypothetical protein N7468_005241 [Penicillium chermesinum]|uniref:Uncharacterized protein n=1 Tax=Penicillium chermesinum TaxID=63820 RepID=A0A9W9TMT6_9EURO|nr:uncharacterized protein N7468_005241 [Penicillium chermesinum]KAJ5232285.1 hypothetical protein N7468_005241 [Penicillium chermesinum]